MKISNEKNKRVLIIVNTYFQLMTAIRIVTTEFMDCTVDFLITDNLPGYEDISERLDNLGFVNNAYKAKCRRISLPRDLLSTVDAVRYCFSTSSFIRKYTDIPINAGGYDVLLFFNMDAFTYIVYEYIQNIKKDIVVRRFEEGFNIYLSFNNRIKSEKICESILRMKRIPSLLQNIESVYLFHPEYLTYDLTQKVRVIPLLSKDNYEYKKIINCVFDYNEQKSATRKLIIFEECFFADKTPINDYELFSDIIKMVSPENVSLKLHPRNTFNRFSETGALVFDGGRSPWEVLQLNKCYEGNVFLTITSGAALSSILYFDEKIPVIFLYKLMDENFKLQTNYEKYLNKIKAIKSDYPIYIPESKEELYSILQDLI